MNKRQQETLVKRYKKYRTAKKINMLEFFRVFMPEIIFRTTKLEGEAVTRKKVSVLLATTTKQEIEDIDCLLAQPEKPKVFDLKKFRAFVKIPSQKDGLSYEERDRIYRQRLKRK